MKILLSLIFLFALSSTGFSQTIYPVKYESQADLKIYMVDYESQADLKVYFVQYESQADLTIYKVKYESQAGWNDKSKSYLLMKKN